MINREYKPFKSIGDTRKGLLHCHSNCVGDALCPYNEFVYGCENTMHKDAAAYIKQLVHALANMVREYSLDNGKLTDEPSCADSYAFAALGA